MLQEWMDHRQREDVSFGEEKLVQGSEQTGSISSILLHALQRVTLAGLVSRAAPIMHPLALALHLSLLKQLHTT